MNTVSQTNGITCSINIFCNRSKSGPTFQLLSSSPVVFIVTLFFFLLSLWVCSVILLVENIQVFHLKMLSATDIRKLYSIAAVNFTVFLVPGSLSLLVLLD